MRTILFPGVLAPRQRWLLGCLGFGLALVIVVANSLPAAAQEAQKGPPPKPQEVFQQVRLLITEGKYDLAAVFLQAFVDSPRTDDDVFELEKRYGTTTFVQLRTIPKWSDDIKTEKQARANTEIIVKWATEAIDKVLKNPTRVQKYIRNLGATYEERQYAEVELRRTSDFAVPFMAESFRKNLDPKISAAILGTIPTQDHASVAAWLAALDGLTPEQQFTVIAAIVSRPDVLLLLNKAQTDFVPYLLWVAGSPSSPPAFRTFATEQLRILLPGARKLPPEAVLVVAARVYAEQRAVYADAAVNPDGRPTTVPVWIWTSADEKLVKQPVVPASQADEYFGLRYARWALEIRPDYEPAQVLVITIATERAMDRGKFGDLARTDPAVYQMLATAPTTVLTDLLARALVEKRTGLTLALTQAIGDRAEKAPASAPDGKLSLLARGLDYPDPRVQLAAAHALLRAAVPVDPSLKIRVIEVLRRAAAADPGVPSGAKGQALVTDPNRQRADASGALLRGLGYDVELFANGRDLLRRVARASDFDLILIDHHVPNPELPDLMAQLQANVNTARRPIMVVASTDNPIPPSLDQLLLRVAVLIAATESDPIVMPTPFVPNLRQPPETRDSERAAVQTQRDNIFRSTAQVRIDRLQRVVDTAGLALTSDQTFQLQLRIEQVTYAALAAEYPLTAESAPRTFEHVAQLQKQLRTQPSVPAYTRRLGIDHLMKVIERLEIDVAKVKYSQDRYDALQSRVDAEALGLVVQSPRDPFIEARVARLVRSIPGVRVIPEPYSRAWFEADVNAAFADPADRPRDPIEKKAAAKLAVGLLAKMATGEIPGFDVKSAAPELIAALRVDDLTDPALQGAARLPSAEAQQALITLALTVGRPLPFRIRAADAAIRHVQANGKLTPDSLAGPIATQSGAEPDPELRGKFGVLKGLLVPAPADYLNSLKTYSPPLIPPAAPMPKDGVVPPAGKPEEPKS